jgi:FKBP-type peptidyl-prolyl cis-trans isomerase 2
MEKVKNGDSVTLNYTGKLDDGTIFDSSIQEGREPLTAKLGLGQLIPGFESGLIGMSVGEKKTIEIQPEDAYGTHQPEMVISIEKSKLPETIEVGYFLESTSPMGNTLFKILEIGDEFVKLDGNHPLSGKKLIFDLELISIN